MKQNGVQAFHSFMRAGLIAMVLFWGMMTAPLAQSATATVTQTLNVQLTAVGELSVPGSVTLIPAGTIFNTYTGSMTVNYRVRSTTGGTGGSITVKATADFSPAGGPAVGSNTFTYTCSGATLGTSCSTTQTVSLTSATNVLTIPTGTCTGGGGSCSAANPNSESMSLSLVNDPGYQTGTYAATLTFTISST